MSATPMNQPMSHDDQIHKIAQAVLYEGYLLYPYRPSTKNRQRWTFGGIFPRDWCQAQQSGDSPTMQTECLLLADDAAVLSVRVRFLQLVERHVGRLAAPVAELAGGQEPQYECVESLKVGSRTLHAWQEAVEREVDTGAAGLAELARQPRRVPFSFGPSRQLEPARAGDGSIEAVLVREQRQLSGAVELRATLVQPGVYRVTVIIENESACPAADCPRDEAQRRSLCSAHAIVHTSGGQFVSLIDPGAQYRELASGCRNQGAWPVLVGDPGEADTMLSAPMILYDYPQIAPESPGDLFDGTEIDEILTLRIMTLSEDEKELARSIDDRARAMLERTDALDDRRLAELHGARREVRPLAEDDGHATVR
jgi:hydrogenase maturation protease